MYNDDEATEFEMNPLGARQRMLPTRTFLSRIPTPVPAPLEAPPMAAAPAQPVLILPPEIHYPDAVDEIISSSMHALPAADSSVGMAALPIASRRFRWLAVPLVSLLALVVLGGAMWQPNEMQAPSIAADIAATDEDVAPGSDQVTASEDPAPDEIIEVKKPAKRIARVVVAKPAKQIAKQPRKVTVNTSTALGNLRPKKAW